MTAEPSQAPAAAAPDPQSRTAAIRIGRTGRIEIRGPRGETTAHAAGDVRPGRAWVWAWLREHAPVWGPGTLIEIDDELTGTQTIAATALAGAPAPDDEGPSPADGGPLPVGGLPRPLDGEARTAVRPGARRKKPYLLAGGGAAAILLAGAVIAAVTLAPRPSPAPEAGPATPTGSALWTLPAGFAPQAAAGPVVAGTAPDGTVALYRGVDGQLLGAGTALRAETPLRALSGDGITVVATGQRSGAVIVGQTVTAYKDLGALLGRGTVPAIAGGTQDSPQAYLIRDGRPVPADAPAKGAALFGGLPEGASAWAVAGGRMILVDAGRTARTVELAKPSPDATVSSWVAVAPTRAAVVWTTSTGKKLRIHDLTRPGGDSLSELPLGPDAQVASEGGGIVTVRDGSAPLRWLSLLDPRPGAPQLEEAGCTADTAVVAGTVWCPAADGRWSSRDFAVAARPVAAGDRFVVIGGGHPAIEPGPEPDGSTQPSTPHE